MSVLRDGRVSVLLTLVVLGSLLSVGLALTRAESDAAGVPPGVTGTTAPGYRPADLVGPGGEALAVAVAAVPATFTYDHRTLDRSLAAATAQMTSTYAQEFTRTFNRRVRPFATQRDAVARGLVRGAGVVRTDGDTAVVCLLYVDQQLVRSRGQRRDARPRVLSRARVRVEMVKRGGAWKVDGIRPV